MLLLVARAVLSVTGLAIDGLLWRAIIGIALCVGTLIFGIIRQRIRHAKA